MRFRRPHMLASLLSLVVPACSSPGGGAGGVCPPGLAGCGLAPDVLDASADAGVDAPAPPSVCGTGAPRVTGRLALGDGLTFDQVRVEVAHKLDVDAFEDGCLTSVRITLGRGSGCELSLEAADAVAHDGGLRVRWLQLAVDSQCPGFADDREGVYSDIGAMERLRVVPSVYRVDARNAESACVPGGLEIVLAGELRDGAGRSLAIGPSSLFVAGEVISFGSTSAACPCAGECGAAGCGDDGCGFSCGGCAAGTRCDEATGTCECAPQCAGRECGDDGCGGTCGALGGACPGDDRCVDGRCLPCQPSCGGRECGDDGCGGVCGACGAEEACSALGRCECRPDCGDAECGPDGCGGTCGACGSDETCVGGGCQATLGDGLCLGIAACAGDCSSQACVTACTEAAESTFEATAFDRWYDCLAGCEPASSNPTDAEIRAWFGCQRGACINQDVACRGGPTYGSGGCRGIASCLQQCDGDDHRCARGCYASASLVAVIASIDLNLCVAEQCFARGQSNAAFQACAVLATAGACMDAAASCGP